ncbi:Mitochondrial amidoxime reducing component 2-like [Frankliniella occidentalis]|uniref:Mitochondrial amidoxime-reducing component 1 n=1 Tax=Frankliniella occidentalis TaxID=133901 RepID=A0A9C6U6M9_FRAOC|nr:mitochondrial amidoxime-reducing component 1 [Frankliniella occidentalis]KAE8746180.1 Mitochondrial amidoxime reducing component 2-like [Frankliniella occidentalis]
MTLLPETVSAAPGRALAVAAGAAVAVGLGVAAARSLAGPRPPPESQWRRVGTLSELALFPLKSGRPLYTDSLLATREGVCQGALRDRVFVAVNRNGCFVSGRTHPGLMKIDVKAVPKDGKSLDDVVFEFHSSRVPTPLKVDPADLAGFAKKKISVQGTSVSAVDCGDEAAAWIRRATVDAEVHGEATAIADLRLAFFPSQRTDRAPYKVASPEVMGIYSDMTAYHLTTSSSLAALNAKLDSPVTTLNFRPNFLVDGTNAFEEDGWSWVRIGDKAVFRVVMPCGRCLLTTVDPETGVKAENVEPLRTLNAIRKPNAEQTKKMGGNSGMFGIRLGIHSMGQVSVGDAVYVAS